MDGSTPEGDGGLHPDGGHPDELVEVLASRSGRALATTVEFFGVAFAWVLVGASAMSIAGRSVGLDEDTVLAAEAPLVSTVPLGLCTVLSGAWALRGRVHAGRSSFEARAAEAGWPAPLAPTEALFRRAGAKWGVAFGVDLLGWLVLGSVGLGYAWLLLGAASVFGTSTRQAVWDIAADTLVVSTIPAADVA